MSSSKRAFVSFPSAPVTQSLVIQALRKAVPSLEIEGSKPDADRLLQWATYDSIDHEATLARSSAVLSSSNIIRKALIRKHFLNRTIQLYVAKNPDSILSKSTPKTWDFEIAFADELDEHWQDDLYDLSVEFEQHPEQWWILKPGMADRGMGLRVFRTKGELADILEGLEASSDLSEDEEDGDGAMLSQLRHFVVQEYLLSPLLFDPVGGSKNPSNGHKFHLRAYCLAVGSLRVFLYSRILALFAAHPYQPLAASDDLDRVDLAAHLTNTSQHAQGQDSDPYVKLLSELVGLPVIGTSSIFTEENVADVVSQMKDILSETFKAAVANPVNFMPLPNAFELFGVDFLVSLEDAEASKFRVSLLEFNAEPAIEMTGDRLRWILEDLFLQITTLCVKPFIFNEPGTTIGAAESFGQLECCLAIDLKR